MRSVLFIIGVAFLGVCSGCGNENPNSGNNVVAPAAPAKEEASKTTAVQEEPAIPVIKAKAPKERIFDWGKKPEEELEGPSDSWVWPSWFCNGPDGAGLRASSTLSAQGKKNYNVVNLSDNDPTTAWVEGHAEDGIGEYIEFNDIMPGTDSELYILNGYQANKESWENNGRVKKLKVTLNGKDIFMIELADAMGAQSVKLPGDFILELEKTAEHRRIVRMTIMEVYPGMKWKDTAITEIFRCMTNPN
jgi:hypothetical protein